MTESALINEFIAKYGDDLKDYDKVKDIRKQLLEEKTFILNQLNLQDNNSKVAEVLNRLDENTKKVNDLISISEKSSNEAEQELEEVQDIRKKLQDKLNKLYNLDCTIQFIKIVQRIESLSNDLEKEYLNKDDERSITVFANLCEISRNLIDSHAFNLRNYLKETLSYWHNILKEKLIKDFDEVLKAIKWPFVNTSFSLITPSHSNIQKLQLLTEYFLQIELPDEAVSHSITSALLSDFPPLSLPIHCLILPLKKRFLYHFHGTRQTNRIDKPEWYFTQILSWIRDHIDFIVKWIQPVISKLGLHHIDAKLEFMRGLVQLSVEKLHSDLPNLQFDDFTFSHSVDEALGFDKELRETYSYPSVQPSIFVVLTQPVVFLKWIAMEKKYAIEKMDVMLSVSSADAFQSIETEEGEYKVTNCADSFVALLQTITERYESLPQPGHRLQFLDLQLDLLDDFRVRLLQLVNAEEGDLIESKIPMMANTIYYVENVLIDWGNMLHFLNLYYYKCQLLNIESKVITTLDFEETPGLELDMETVFADTLPLYRHMRKDLLSTLSESVVQEIKMCSKNYRRERWSTMLYHKDVRSLSLTPSACPMFEVLSRRLHQLQKFLATKLFTIVWRFIAQELDVYLFEELVLDNRFNDGGAAQLKYDITRNLFPLFAQFSEKPDNYFIQLNETCNLLNISKGSALLLRETILALEGATGVEDRRGIALKEVGVMHFSPQMSLQILNRRTDITINRMTID